MFRQFMFIASVALTGACSPVPRAAVAPPAPMGGPTTAPSGDNTLLAADASPVTFERMATFPSPGWQVPRNIQFAPDGATITFLQSEKQGEQMAMFELNAASGAIRKLISASDVANTDAPMSVEEELRRERQRKRIKGITDYAWAKKSNAMVLPLAGDVFLRSSDGSIAQLTNTEAPEIDPRICASGKRIAYVRDRELWAYDVPTNTERQLTRNAPDGVSRGLTDFNGQEEFGQAHGFFWSTDCETIAFLEVDERKVGQIPILGYRQNGDNFMRQRFPRTGTDNPSVRIGIVSATGGEPRWVAMDAAIAEQPYWVDFRFSSDGKQLFAQAIHRNQKSLQLVRIDVDAARATPLLKQSSPHWIDASMMHLDRSGKWFAWTAETGGHIHLQVRDASNGKLIAWRTAGGWDVTGVLGSDPSGDSIYVMGTSKRGTERHLFAIPRKGDEPIGDPAPLTELAGVHSVALGPKGQRFVDVHSAADRPPKATVMSTKGQTLHQLPVPRDADFDALKIKAARARLCRDPGWHVAQRRASSASPNPAAGRTPGGVDGLRRSGCSNCA